MIIMSQIRQFKALSGSIFLGGIMDLLKDNLRKLYLRFLIPSLGSAMVMSIYKLTDAIVIGKGVGADALAALSITTPPVMYTYVDGYSVWRRRFSSDECIQRNW